MFNIAALYGAALVIFGMLSLRTSYFSEKRERMTKMYGTPVPKHNLDDNSTFGRLKNFSKHFFLRPSFLTGVFMGGIILRNYDQPILSCFLAFSFSVIMLKELNSYGTKFIPMSAIAIGLIYGTMHLVGWQYGWHESVEGLSIG